MSVSQGTPLVGGVRSSLSPLPGPAPSQRDVFPCLSHSTYHQAIAGVTMTAAAAAAAVCNLMQNSHLRCNQLSRDAATQKPLRATDMLERSQTPHLKPILKPSPSRCGEGASERLSGVSRLNSFVITTLLRNELWSAPDIIVRPQSSCRHDNLRFSSNSPCWDAFLLQECLRGPTEEYGLYRQHCLHHKTSLDRCVYTQCPQNVFSCSGNSQHRTRRLDTKQR